MRTKKINTKAVITVRGARSRFRAMLPVITGVHGYKMKSMFVTFIREVVNFVLKTNMVKIMLLQVYGSYGSNLWLANFS